MESYVAARTTIFNAYFLLCDLFIINLLQNVFKEFTIALFTFLSKLNFSFDLSQFNKPNNCSTNILNTDCLKLFSTIEGKRHFPIRIEVVKKFQVILTDCSIHRYFAERNLP